MVNKYFAYERPEILRYIPNSTTKLLDVGCGIGNLGKKFKENHSCHVTGIEIVPEVVEIAKQNIDRVFCYDLDTVQAPFLESEFDCIVFADILEHLKNPEKILSEYLKFLKKDGIVIISIPNVRNLEVIENLINGSWEYQDAGILDRTHLKFFTQKEFLKILYNNNLEILNLDYLIYGKFSNIRTNNGILSLPKFTINNVTENELNEFKAVQLVFNCKK